MRKVIYRDIKDHTYFLANKMCPKIHKNNITGDIMIVSPLNFKAELYSVFESEYMPYKYYFKSYSDFEEYYYQNIEQLVNTLLSERILHQNNLIKFDYTGVMYECSV